MNIDQKIAFYTALVEASKINLAQSVKRDIMSLTYQYTRELAEIDGFSFDSVSQAHPHSVRSGQQYMQQRQPVERQREQVKSAE